MGVAIFSIVLEMIKNITSLCNKVADAGDSEKYARSINELSQGVSDSYSQMRNIICNSDKFSDDEKLIKLQELAGQEIEAKRKCDEMVKENRKNIGKIVLYVFEGLLTCGLSFAPAIIEKINNATSKGDVVSTEEIKTIIDEA